MYKIDKLTKREMLVIIVQYSNDIQEIIGNWLLIYRNFSKNNVISIKDNFEI